MAAEASDEARVASLNPGDPLVDEFITYLKRRNVDTSGSHALAQKTVLFLRSLITQKKWSTCRDLLDLIRGAGQAIASGRASESVVGNLTRRVLRLVREAYSKCVREDRQVAGTLSEGSLMVQSSTMDSLHDLLVAPERADDYTTHFRGLKGAVVQSVNDLLEELEESAHNIAIQALEHIHADEVIMTVGRSRTVEAFLCHAAKTRPFHVIVAESAPSYQGQDMARRLAEAGIETTLITDSAIFAMMSRVNKVFIGTNAVMADGGLMALNGCHALALAAKYHSVPVIVCAAMFKLSPRYLCSYDQDTFNNLCSPTDVLPYGQADVVDVAPCLHPLFDYVPPDLINLIISNIGGNAPSYIYRLLSEYYDAADFELE